MNIFFLRGILFDTAINKLFCALFLRLYHSVCVYKHLLTKFDWLLLKRFGWPILLCMPPPQLI